MRDPKDILTPITHDEQELFVKKYVSRSDDTPFRAWNIIEVEGQSIGSVTLNKRLNELGYWLMPEYIGSGYGTRAVRLFIEKHPRDYYTAFIRPDNIRSRKMIEKFGFKVTHLKYTSN